MAKKSMPDIVATIVEELTPLDSEERRRVVQASLTLLGEMPVKDGAQQTKEESVNTEEGNDLPPRARAWMRQNGLSLEQISHVFHFAAGDVEVIAAIPGSKNREKVRNAYVLLGIARLLVSDEPKFDDKSARALCERSGFYDLTNHMKYVKGGNEFSGSKDKGWTLTTPGLKHGAVLVMGLAKDA